MNKTIEKRYGIKNGNVCHLPKEIEMATLKQNAKNEQNLQDTFNYNWAVDDKGNYNKWNEKNNKYDLIKNVSKLNKDGSYETSVKNKKAQNVKTSYDQDQNPQNIKVLNFENKKYTNPDYAAKIAGLKKEKEILTDTTIGSMIGALIQLIQNSHYNNAKATGCYIDVKNLTIYNWDEKNSNLLQ